jgi:site-specific recombinase XerD
MITKSEDGKRSYTGARLYDLRHCAASTMLANGVDPVRVAQYMGHSPAVLFSTYAHVIAETATEAVA